MRRPGLAHPRPRLRARTTPCRAAWRAIAALLGALLAGPWPGAAVAQTVAPGTPAPPASPAVSAAATAPTAADAAFDAALLAQINQLRRGQGLAAWQPDAHLQQIAAAHAQALAQQGRLSHGGFDARLARSGASLCVENLAAGPATPVQLVAAWQASAGHRANLLEPQAQAVGLARHQGVVVMFACRADAGRSPQPGLS